MEDLKKEELQKASGGVSTDTPHCPKCQSKDLMLVGRWISARPPVTAVKPAGMSG